MKYPLNPLLKPDPLPPGASLLDRLEYALQWLVWVTVIHLPGKPALSGLLTGIVTPAWMFLIGFGIYWIVSHLWK
jgi:hypothetical protein